MRNLLLGNRNPRSRFNETAEEHFELLRQTSRQIILDGRISDDLQAELHKDLFPGGKRAFYDQREKLAMPELMDDIACGQRVAIYPQSAISHSEFPSTTIRAIQFEQMPTTEQVMALLKTRRSIRAYRRLFT